MSLARPEACAPILGPSKGGRSSGNLLSFGTRGPSVRALGRPLSVTRRAAGLGRFAEGQEMSTEDPRKPMAGGAVARDSQEVLGPMIAPRAPLQRAAGGAPPALLAPQLARLEQELSLVRKSLRAQRAETRVEKQSNALLRAELQALRGALGERGTQPRGDDGEVNRLSQEQRQAMEQFRMQCEARTLDLEARCAREIALLEEKHAAKMSAVRNSLRASEELTLAKTERIRRLEARLNRLQVGEAEVQALTRSSDDLTVLRGVGPAYALALRRQGVVSLCQIAAWTREDIQAIAPKIGTTEARILREGWVTQARKLGRE